MYSFSIYIIWIRFFNVYNLVKFILVENIYGKMNLEIKMVVVEGWNKENELLFFDWSIFVMEMFKKFFIYYCFDIFLFCIVIWIFVKGRYVFLLRVCMLFLL